MSTEKKTLVLLDAHAIIHRAYHALPTFFSSKGVPTGALYGLSNMLMKIISDLRPDFIVACYDLPQKTFRHEAYTSYKAGRAKTDDALISQLISSRKIFEAFDVDILDCPGFEADDILGTIVEKFKDDDSLNIIIASGDMDTLQLVSGEKVRVYTLKKGINDTIIYNQNKVEERFGFPPLLIPDFKGLRGDPSDNIIGIKGIGEKTAQTLIQNFGSIEEIYKIIHSDDGESKLKSVGVSERIFNLLKEGEEEALFSKTLAKIRRDAPVKFDLSKKIFWEKADIGKIEKVFIDFDFRSLLPRLKNFFTKNSDEKNILPEEEKSLLLNKENTNSDDPELLQNTSIALWLLNSDLSNPSLPEILNYANTNSLPLASERIFKELKEKNLLKLFEEIEKPIISSVENMEKIGIKIDVKYFSSLEKEYQTFLSSLEKKIYDQAGVEFNINSPKQLGSVLFEKMNLKLPSGKKPRKSQTGAFSTKFEILEELEEENPIIKEIMLYRELKKLLSTYIETIPKMVSKDGRLHARFLQNNTTTGRFSSQDPNLQNLPIKTEFGRRIRNGFVAEKGASLLSFDYSQIELRVAAILSKDKKMTEIFKAGKDIHQGVASFVFGVSLSEVNDEMRRKAKAINFGMIYGMGVSSLRKSIGGTLLEAKNFYDNYFKQFNGVKDYLESVLVFARKNFYTETLFGRRRYFPNINSRIPFLKNMAERTAINAPIQGTATADIIKLAIRYAEEDLKKANLLGKVRLVLQIHDELVYEVDNDVLETAEKIIKSAMENVLERSYLHYKSEVPLVVHSGSGVNLGEV